ncbi:dTDP-4-dehydrorhamnose reductase (modular protein) [Desulfarculales bacterium]
MGEAQAQVSLGLVAEALPELGVKAEELHACLDILRLALKEGRPRLVFNCLGYTDVEMAEQEPELAETVHDRGVQPVARACSEAWAHLMHLSTNFVFDGRGNRPYCARTTPSALVGLMAAASSRASAPGARRAAR